MSQTIINKCEKVLHMQRCLPDGTIRDADTVLQDIFDEIEPEVTGVATEIINLYLNFDDAVSIAKMFEVMTGCSFEAFLDRAIQVMERNYAENAVCCGCHKHYSMIIEKITDANGSRFFCPNCLAIRYHDMSLVNIPSLKDDVTGKPGAVVFESYKERYQLDAECMRRLISHRLNTREVRALRQKYGANAFMLHDDFYDDKGHAIQPYC